MSSGVKERKDGTAGVFLSRNLPAWHGLGFVKEGYWTLEEVLQPQHLGWEVRKIPAGIMFDGKFYPSLTNYDEKNPKINKPEMFVTRMDKMQPLGKVTDDYVVFQNAEAGEFVEAITGDPDVNLETAGELDYGRRIWFLASLKKSLYVGGDEIKPYFLITTSHDGTGRIRVTTCNERVVCANTLAVALGEKGMSFGIRHVGNVEDRLTEARGALGLVKAYQTDFLTFANNLVAKKMTKRAVEKVIERLEPLPDNASPKKTSAVQKARDIIMQCMNVADLQNFSGTAWQVFNAVTDADQHRRELRGADKDPQGYKERAFTATFEGPMLDRRNLLAQLLLKA